MIEIKAGANISVAEMRSGAGSRGDWCMVPVKAEKGYDRMTVWATNPSVAKDIKGAATIYYIKSAKLSAKQGKDGKWYPEYSVDAELRQAAVDTKLADPDAVEDDDLPFA